MIELHGVLVDGVDGARRACSALGGKDEEERRRRGRGRAEEEEEEKETKGQKEDREGGGGSSFDRHSAKNTFATDIAALARVEAVVVRRIRSRR